MNQTHYYLYRFVKPKGTLTAICGQWVSRDGVTNKIKHVDCPACKKIIEAIQKKCPKGADK